MGAARLQADLGNAVVLATFFTSLLFVPAISFIWPWWQHFYARAAVSVDVLLTLAFLPSVLQLLFGLDGAAYRWFALTVFALIPVRTVWLGVSIWRLQRGPGAGDAPPVSS